MAINGKRLKMWTGEPEEVFSDASSMVPLPTPSDVLYARMTTTGQRKKCGNCWAWSLDEKCAVHAESFPTPRNGVCGHHIEGIPRDVRLVLPLVEPVDPATSGFKVSVGGISCDTCTFYSPAGAGHGLCTAVADSGFETDLIVDALASCTRWEPVDF